MTLFLTIYLFVNYRVRSRVYEKGTLISAEESKPSKGMVTTNSRVVANVHPVELGTENRLFRDNEVPCSKSPI